MFSFEKQVLKIDLPIRSRKWHLNLMQSDRSNFYNHLIISLSDARLIEFQVKF